MLMLDLSAIYVLTPREIMLRGLPFFYVVRLDLKSHLLMYRCKEKKHVCATTYFKHTHARAPTRTNTQIKTVDVLR